MGWMFSGPQPKLGFCGFTGRAFLRSHPKVLRPVRKWNGVVKHVPPPHGWPELHWLAMLLWKQARTRRKPKA